MRANDAGGHSQTRPIAGPGQPPRQRGVADDGLHVAHVLHSLEVGGTENGVVNLVTRLGGVRHSVIAMTTAGPLAARLPAGVGVRCLGKRPGIDARAILRLARELRRLRPTVVHSRNWGALDAVLAARLARVPVVIHGEHGREASDLLGLDPRRNRLRRLAARLVDRFVTVSFDLRRWLIETVRIPAARVVTIHNGVDTERFGDEGREAGRAALGLAPDRLVVGAVGRLDPVKDHAGLLAAFALVAEASAMLVIVGEGPCRSPLETRVRALGLGERVRLLGERGDVALLLRGLDVFVLPSLGEGISNTLLEAMATGLPVVATRVGGNPELVEDGVNGRLVPPADPGALAGALAEYLADPALRALHGKTSRQLAVERFGLDRMAARYRKLYRGLAGGEA